MTLRLAGLLLPLALVACSHSSHSESAPGPEAVAPPREFPSSVALLLQHREELALTEEQAKQLDTIETGLQEKNTPLRKKLEELRPAGGHGGGHGGGHRGGGDDGGGGMGGPMGGGMGGGMGGPMGGGMGGMGGMGGGRRGGMGGGRMGGGGRGGHGGSDSDAGHERFAQLKATIDEMEANDNAAYEEAEKVLTEQQKPRARELVSQQREEELKQREAMRERMRNQG
jgi:hypothetical protein